MTAELPYRKPGLCGGLNVSAEKPVLCRSDAKSESYDGSPVRAIIIEA